MQAGFITAIIGALGGWFGGFVQQLYVGHRDRRTMRNIFLALIANDLVFSVSLFEKIQEQWSENAVIWLPVIQELRYSRMFFSDPGTSRNLALLKPIWRDDIQKYYLESERIIVALDAIQKRYDELYHLKAQVARSIKEKESNLTATEINTRLQDLFAEEMRELEWLSAHRSLTMAKLTNLISLANTLLDKLKNLR